jgi:3D (Asp-Asp-Asp) domain-containing protein
VILLKVIKTIYLPLVLFLLLGHTFPMEIVEQKTVVYKKQQLKPIVKSVFKSNSRKLAHIEKDILEHKQIKINPNHKPMTFSATFYNVQGGTGTGITASGLKVQDGVTVAVDESIIPRFTWLKITYPNGKYEIRQAQDTGGAIKGYEIDIYYDKTTRELLQLGRQTVKVEIIDKP